MSLNFELPKQSGAYRWLYADVVAGDFTAVVIFMVGSIFSPRYSTGARRGALPTDYCAVNFAFYDRSATWFWVLTEYPKATQLNANNLSIGQSSWRIDGNRVTIEIVDRTAPWGKPARAEIVLDPLVTSDLSVALSADEAHHWTPRMPRARGHIRIPSINVDVEGLAYHDGNHGREQLGPKLPGWRWTRIHHKDRTEVFYEPQDFHAWSLTTANGSIALRRQSASAISLKRSGWGLRVPSNLIEITSEPTLQAPRLLESSPFYARLEAHGAAGTHAMTEVANFRRFHRAPFRWMAHFRTRTSDRPGGLL